MGVTSTLVFYIIPGLLGRGYNINQDTVGPDLFDVKHVDTNKKVIEKYITTSEYKLVSDLEEAKDFLDVSGKLALKIKAGNINVEGAGSYLKQAGSFHNKIELLFKVYYETVTTTIPSDIKPLAKWNDYAQRSKDTHYIRSITYGGHLIASVSFVASSKSDLEHIKGSVEAEMKSKSGSFGGGLKGKLEKIANSTTESSSITVNYFATVPLTEIPRDIDGLVTLVQNFPEQAQKVKGGWGVPVQMEIFSLQGLEKSKTTYFQTVAFTNNMVMLEEQFADLRTTRRRLNDWMHTIPPRLSDAAKKDITEFNNRLEEATKTFNEVIGNIDLTSGKDAGQFDPAYKAYQGKSDMIYPDMYVKELSKLKVKVLNSVKGLDPNFGGAIYTYWGNENCPGSISEKVPGTEGKMASTIKISVGTTKFLCLTKSPEYIPVEIDRYDDVRAFEDLPEVHHVAFSSRTEQNSGYTVPCAHCRIPGKTTVTMLPGKTACNQGWTEQYRGVLASTDYNSGRSELVCLDFQKQRFTPDKITPDNHYNVLTEVSMSKAPATSIPCVVCSAKKSNEGRSARMSVV